MVGYTALAQRNESLALQLLDKHNALIRSVAKEHRGREVKTIGDAFLLEFDSALEAVLCSVRIQSSFREMSRTAAPDERILVRIGIHVGDVIHQGGDILGDAVNIASRIVHFAENGGICISEQVYAQVRNKVQLPLLKMPGQELRSVGQQMDLYHVVLPWEPSGPQKSSARWRRIRFSPSQT